MILKTVWVTLVIAVAAILAWAFLWREDADPLPVYNITIDGQSVTVVLPDGLGDGLPPGVIYSSSAADTLEPATTSATGNAIRFIWFQAGDFSAGKKRLRAEIEANTTGEARVQLLRRVVPVISDPCYTSASPDDDLVPTANIGLQQFKDDLIYSKDNFGGVGWASGTACDAHGDAVLLDAAERVFRPAPR